MMMNVNKTSLGGGREVYFDALKCIGILLVIRGHVELFGLGISKTYEEMSCLMMYSFNMPIFFFISGYFAYKENMTTRDIGRNLWNKFLFLVLPAVAFSVFYRFCNGENPIRFINDGFGRYWFTITLFLCFLVYYLVRLTVFAKRWQGIVMIVLSLAGIGYLSFFSKYGVPLLDLNHLTKYFQYFTLGILAKMYHERYVRLLTNQALIAAVTIGFFVLLVALFQCAMPSFVHHTLRDLVLRYMGTFMIISLFFNHKEVFCKETKVNKLISYIGRYTLPIYLLQYFFMPDLGHFAGIIDNLDMLTINIICMGYTTVITVLCVLFIWLLSNSRIVSKYVLGQRN